MGCNCGGSPAPRTDPCAGLVALPTNSHGPETSHGVESLARALNDGTVKIYIVYSRSVTLTDLSVFDSVSNEQVEGAVRALDGGQLPSATGLNFRFVPAIPCNGSGCIIDGKVYTVAARYTEPCSKTQQESSWQFHT